MVTEIVKLLLAAAAGFASNFLIQRAFQRKVKLEHELGTAGVFSTFTPEVSFQDLRITNVGNAPVTGVKVALKQEIFSRGDVAFKVKSDEPFEKIIADDIVSLVFQRLVPSESIEIAFKSSHPLPAGFLVGIKSNEIISTPARRGSRTSSDSFLINFGLGMIATVLAVFVGWSIGHGPYHKTPATPTRADIAPLGLNLTTEKGYYYRGDSASVYCTVTNLSDSVLCDVTLLLVVRGFELDYAHAYRIIHFLDGGAAENWQTGFFIGHDVLVGTHSISLQAWGYLGNNAVRSEVEKEFAVR